jgi:uncharacterized protein YgbK (DUF1537 family)
VAIIADDLTGAADAAGYFAELGFPTAVCLHHGQWPSADVVAVSTDSRGLSREGAAERTRVVASAILAHRDTQPARWVYKKIDSTLRGHPGAELAAVMDVLRTDRALVAPAFPAQGRTTVSGVQLLNGITLDATEFADGPVSAAVPELFRPYVARRSLHAVTLDTVKAGHLAITAELQSGKHDLFIADARTEADLLDLARAAVACDVDLLCGSGGLARALADTLSPAAVSGPPGQPSRRAAPVLIVAGSRHPVTASQVEVAASHGGVLVRIALDVRAQLDTSCADEQETAEGSLAAGKDVILATVGQSDRSPTYQRFSDRLAGMVRALAGRAEIGGLVLTGGDTAAAVVLALGSDVVRLGGEVSPGIPWGWLGNGPHPGLPVVLKAGGFGSRDTLVQCVEHLHRM